MRTEYVNICFKLRLITRRCETSEVSTALFTKLDAYVPKHTHACSKVQTNRFARQREVRPPKEERANETKSTNPPGSLKPHKLSRVIEVP